jgi:hypothetical protein
MLPILESKLVSKYDYLTLGEINKMAGVKEMPAPTRIFATLNKTQTAIFNRLMENKESALYKAVSAGRKMHHALETGKIKDAATKAAIRVFEKDIAGDIDEVYGAEMGLLSLNNHFKGKFDSVGVFRGKTTMWDYKKVNKLKTPSQIKNYLKQAAAYAIAHDEMYGTKINQIAIMMVGGKTPAEMTSRVYTYGGAELKEIKASFLEDLNKFYSI